MQIDFHQSQAKVSPRRARHEFHIPVIVKRILGLCVALIGILCILLSVLSLLVTKSDSPYALMLFEQASAGNPQTHVHVIWINEAKGTAQITQLPDPLEFHSQSLGTYPIESIYAARAATKQSNADFLTDVSFFFRFPIKSYVYTTTPISRTKSSLGTLVLNSCFSGKNASTFGECIHLALFFSSFGTTVRELTFPQSALGNGNIESIKPLNRSVYREWSQSHFSESFKGFHKYTVAVLNGTQTSGLATLASNIVSDFGLTVLYVGETVTPQRDGEIVITQQVSTVPAIEDFLKATLKLPVRIDDTIPARYRSDVVVIIGEKEVKFFEP